ncbi:MAG: hypothetical protein WBP29_12220 [Candidatus Zixiibacteriota bacterium]
MKKMILFGLACFLITSSLVIAETPAPTTPPAKVPVPAAPPSKAKIVTDMTDFEFGWIPSNSYVSHTYWFYSQGEDSLKILSVQPG